jgi:nicotinate phosphoribosyltransferase
MDDDERDHLKLPKCTNNLATALLTDAYQITMAYAYYKNQKHEQHASFDLIFRKNPFNGEFTIFAGLEEALKFVSNFKFTRADVEYLRQCAFASAMDEEFFDEYLLKLDCSEVVIEANLEGSVVFPRVPLLHVTGPLGVAQLLETTLLTMINYASLVATNAARHRLTAGDDIELLEFGLRRAQGVDGGVSASRYAYVGGFDATSNCEAGRQFGIPVKGTHAHSFVQAHSRWEDIKCGTLKYGLEPAAGLTHQICPDFPKLVRQTLDDLRQSLSNSQQFAFGETNESELIAFCAYALAFPKTFLALIDTYDTLKSGTPNFVAVALALRACGYSPLGVRIDSGDLSYLSLTIRKFLEEAETCFVSSNKLVEYNDDMKEGNTQSGYPEVFAKGLAKKTKITASNDINETVLRELKQSGHSIDAFGIGTALVTCMAQPALGCVYKLVEIDEKPRIKLSEDVDKVTIPGKKQCFRLYGKIGEPIVDVMIRKGEKIPEVNERILCRHPFLEGKRAFVTPAKVEKLLLTAWDGPNGGCPIEFYQTLGLEKSRERVKEQVKLMRADHLRYTNPTPYKVSVSDGLYTFTHQLWLDNLPARELS